MIPKVNTFYKVKQSCYIGNEGEIIFVVKTKINDNNTVRIMTLSQQGIYREGLWIISAPITTECARLPDLFEEI